MDSTSPSLVLAITRGDLSQVKSLISQGYSVNSRDDRGATALHWSCYKNKEKICDYLIDVGSDVNARLNNGSTALHVAVDHGCQECVKILIQRYADLNAANDRCDTPLHTAAYRGHLDIVKLLIQGGANPLLRNKHGLTPIEEASSRNFPHCVQYLLPYNANILMSGILNSSKCSDDKTIKQSSTPQQDNHTKLGSYNVPNLNNLNGTITEKYSLKVGYDNFVAPSATLPSGVLSLDSDYSSYASDKDWQSYCDRSPSVDRSNEEDSFHSLLNKSVTVKSLTGSPIFIKRSDQLSNKMYEETTKIDAMETPPELPPRPLWLCKPLPAQQSQSKVDFKLTNKLVVNGPINMLEGSEVNEFIEQLQIKMVEMQELLFRYKSCNTQLIQQVQHLSRENTTLRAENGQLKSQKELVNRKQVNNYHQAISDLDEGVHLESYLLNAGNDKVDLLKSYPGHSLYLGPGSRQPVESNELS